MALQSLAFYTLIDWFAPYAQAHGYSQRDAGWLLFLYQAIAIVANLGCIVALKRLRDTRLTAVAASAAIFCGVLHEQSGDWTLPLALLASLSFFQLLLAPFAGSSRQRVVDRQPVGRLILAGVVEQAEYHIVSSASG
ncbi:hypothetical protein [Candidatus Pantoea persica]|uniref:hypothetical protein n=1 Tax=Candidatus Pantoea persica TaxID=2518128 RepID=UPI0028682658|nr:hypothetical protein [Candidatus Pantoea persica]MBA2813944.1 MFS transporter [Candidatus Pantoea persica]